MDKTPNNINPSGSSVPSEKPSENPSDIDKPTSSGTSSDGSNKACECNICFDNAKDPVVGFCGHLFCWPCLHYWLETQGNNSFCPVCKAAINKSKVIPLYGRGETKGVDPRLKKVPPRPKAQRTEASNATYREYQAGNGFGLGSGNGGSFQFSLGLGVFPFTIFGVDFGNNRQRNAGDNATANDTLFIAIAILFILWLCLI